MLVQSYYFEAFLSVAALLSSCAEADQVTQHETRLTEECCEWAHIRFLEPGLALNYYSLLTPTHLQVTAFVEKVADRLYQ